MEPTESPVKKSSIPGEIIKVLQKEKSSRFKELKDRLQVSGPTLSIHLKSLMSDDIIKFEKKGREKHYSLSKNASKDFESQVSLFSSILNSTYDISPSDFKSISSVLEYISDNTGFIFSFVLLKSIKTGKNWTKAFDAREIVSEAMDLLVYALFEKNVDVEKLRKNIMFNSDLSFQEIHELSKKKKNRPLIDELLERWEEKDPEKFTSLEEGLEYSMTEYED